MDWFRGEGRGGERPGAVFACYADLCGVLVDGQRGRGCEREGVKTYSLCASSWLRMRCGVMVVRRQIVVVVDDGKS